MLSVSDFDLERRYLHENVWPELQRHCAAAGVDLEVLDIQMGNDLDSAYDPNAFELQLKEIEQCYQESLGCFLVVLIGNKYKPCPLPRCIEATEFDPIYEKAQEAGFDVSLLTQWYSLNANMVPPAYTIRSLHSKNNRFSLRRPSDVPKRVFETQTTELVEEEEQVLKMIQYGARVAHQEGIINQNKDTRQKRYFMSAVYNQLDFALGLSNTSSQRIICVIRQIEANDPCILRNILAEEFLFLRQFLWHYVRQNLSATESSVFRGNELILPEILRIANFPVQILSFPTGTS
ncbi:NACHT and WD repeat domain-containing protein 2 [Caerostris darwini]|uniref:NACHT and WD repeat domain-containing protein 2 n=1 Tax=Caerostris darwini TaxID=1538125 RepID=A0AAV4S5V2_9ARAC|nr:NACHT and WD repeat domain-containing protein 2 [Caerostris darwini]